MNPVKTRTLMGLIAAFAIFAAACSGGASTEATDPPVADTGAAVDPAAGATEPAAGATEPAAGGTDAAAAPADTASICGTDDLVAAVEGGPAEGTLAGMTDDPVATAASNNPVLTTLVTAVGAAGLGDTLNGAEALTVFAPTDCAFAAMDPATLEAALADPMGLLTTVLGYHVVTERLTPEDLAGVTELTTFTEEVLPVSVGDDGAITVGEQATVVVPDIQTANATVYLIDAVMLPPSAQ